MARRTIAIEEKLAKAEEVMVKAKKKYDESVAEVNGILKLQTEKRMEELVMAAMSSKQSFDDIMTFIKSTPDR